MKPNFYLKTMVLIFSIPALLPDKIFLFSDLKTKITKFILKVNYLQVSSRRSAATEGTPGCMQLANKYYLPAISITLTKHSDNFIAIRWQTPPDGNLVFRRQK